MAQANTRISRSASVDWSGPLKSGKGKINTRSGALDRLPYSFNTRFADEAGTNPEELLGAAHAACFTMAVASELDQRRLHSPKLHTDVEVVFGNAENEWSVGQIRLTLTGQVALAEQEEFKKAAHYAKEHCPLSRALRPEILLEIKFDERLHEVDSSDHPVSEWDGIQNSSKKPKRPFEPLQT